MFWLQFAITKAIPDISWFQMDGTKKILGTIVTIPHNWNTFNLREWHDLRNSLAVILPLHMLPISVTELTHQLLIDTTITTRVPAVAYY